MAEDSAFWDGIVTGDAASTDVWSAPYSSLEYGDFYTKLMGSNVARGYVIPGYNNSLAVTANSPAALNVLVKTGAMFIRGKIYENTAQQTVTIAAADATNPRLDRIVARITFASQTIRIAVLTGTPAATPALPTLTQNATTYEIPLGYIWVAALAATIAEAEVHDERVFLANPETLLSYELQNNLLENSEFLAFSRLSTIPTTNAGQPDRWDLVGTATFASATKPAQMSRGRAIAITAGAATSGMSQTFRCEASQTYAVRALVNVTALKVGIVKVTDNGGTPVTISRNVRRTGSYIEEIIVITTASDATAITVSLMGNANTDVMTVGQTIAVKGFVVGPYRQVHETIMFFHRIGDTNWNGSTKSSGTTTIDCTTAFQALILPGTRGMVMQVSTQDSGSLAGNCSIGLRATGGTLSSFTAATNGLPNSTQRIITGLAAFDSALKFDVIVTATGAGTQTVSLGIEGILT